MAGQSMITIEEARKFILERTRQMPPETVPLDDAAGRVLAREVITPVDSPSADNSQMDGYAARAADLAGASSAHAIRLPVAREIAAGRPPGAIAAGTCARIFTGGLLPEGADTVIPQEVVQRDGNLAVFTAAPRPGEYVRRRGEDVTAGAAILRAGDVLTPARIGLAAACGETSLAVISRPRVTILANGDEVVEPGRPKNPEQVYNANAFTLSALARECGASASRCPIAGDSEDALAAVIQELHGPDVIISSGGVSVGDHDYVARALTRCGWTIHPWKISMRPGKPMVFAARGHQLWFGLPGNPVSSAVAFEHHVRPALRKMAGHRALTRPLLRGVLLGPVGKQRGFRFFLRGLAAWNNGRIEVQPSTKTNSGQLGGLAESNVLIVVPEGVESMNAGEETDLMPLSWTGYEPFWRHGET
ncbi:MAG: Molybdopterin molybdenumtransferase [Myxococcota bacterium]|nr:Molybdopterin molybdenumtransferase [Myxococcota bacterium]